MSSKNQKLFRRAAGPIGRSADGIRAAYAKQKGDEGRARFRRWLKRWAAFVVAILVVTVAACNPYQRGGYGNSNGQPPATMTTVGGYSGQAGAGYVPPPSANSRPRPPEETPRPGEARQSCACAAGDQSISPHKSSLHAFGHPDKPCSGTSIETSSIGNGFFARTRPHEDPR